MGIQGNRTVDRAAKAALSQDISPFKIPFFDSKLLINLLIHEYWQRDHDDQNYDNIHSDKPLFGDLLPALKSFRRNKNCTCPFTHWRT